MTVSLRDRKRLKQALAQNGLSDIVLKSVGTGKRIKRKLYKVAMNRDPSNPCTPWAARFSDEDKRMVEEAWISRI